MGRYNIHKTSEAWQGKR